MSDRIEHQKRVGSDVLDRLFAIDPTCILAGGAPRDWYLGKPASDLDFYVYDGRTGTKGDITSGIDTSCEVFLKRLEAVGLVSGWNLLCKPEVNDYSHMPSINSVWENVIGGERVQIMRMCEPTFNVISLFDTSICRAYCVGDCGSIHKHPSFEASIKSGIITVLEGYDKEVPHVTKMMERFPDYTFEFNEAVTAHQPPPHTTISMEEEYFV